MRTNVKVRKKGIEFRASITQLRGEIERSGKRHLKALFKQSLSMLDLSMLKAEQMVVGTNEVGACGVLRL